jgi:hypothetical protein
MLTGSQSMAGRPQASNRVGSVEIPRHLRCPAFMRASDVAETEFAREVAMLSDLVAVDLDDQGGPLPCEPILSPSGNRVRGIRSQLAKKATLTRTTLRPSPRRGCSKGLFPLRGGMLSSTWGSARYINESAKLDYRRYCRSAHSCHRLLCDAAWSRGACRDCYAAGDYGTACPACPAGARSIGLIRN